jgi:hypothetical protein
MRRALLVHAAAVLLLGVGCTIDSGIGSLNDSGEATNDSASGNGGDNVPGEPVADAGSDRVVPPLDEVALNGSESYDPDGLKIDKYRWEMVSRPPASSAELRDVESAWPSFNADVAGKYEITLSVQNEKGVWDSTPDTVVIEARPTVGFYVQLTWDAAGIDLDLHLLKQNAPLWSATGDCYWCNTSPEWGLSGLLDDPSFDRDNRDGYGPETITIEAPANGVYDVAVHYYGEDGLEGDCWSNCPGTVATVNFYNNGTLTHTVTQPMNDALQLWKVGSVSWPSGTFTNDGSVRTADIDGACE